MGSDQALSQLLEMGIPRARARAALKRTKGDAMGAAERVFAGEYDAIPSDQDDDDEDNDLFIITGQTKKEIIMVLDDDDGMENDGGSDFDMEEDVGFEVDDEDEGEERLWSDPYAGVFFSADRVENVIEPVEDPTEVRVKVAGRDQTVTVLSRGEWMSGCPEEGEQSHLFQLYSMLESPFPCPHGCGGSFKREAGKFFAIFSEFNDYAIHLQTILRPSCPNCKRFACLACGEKANGCKAHPNPSRSKELDELLHCVNIQGLIIGMGLYMIEKSFEPPQKAPSAETSGSPATKKLKTDKKVQPRSSRGTNQTGGTGYAGNAQEDRSGQLRAEMEQEKRDERTKQLLSRVRVYLPTISRESGSRASDHMVHPTALANLRRRSGFVNDLLRNDSLLDMSNRRGLYEELFNWLEVVSSHESLASMLAMPQMRSVSEFPDPDTPGQNIVMYEGSPSPRELLESCVIQAQAALRGLSSTRPLTPESEGAADQDPQQMTIQTKANEHEKESKLPADCHDANDQLQVFCKRIIDSAKKIDRSLIQTKGRAFVDRMLEGLPKLPESGVYPEESIQDDGRGETVIKTYENWVTRARFQYCDMSNGTDSSGSVIYSHAYNTLLQSTSNLSAPKRSLAIAKELAILTRNLPAAWHSSIFLRVDEARVDCLKAMIIGPEGTPYENGCFIFDIYLPECYNHQCPLVKTMTTNGGKYRYNPNLYADGKVCLSLLGTWSGPGWISGKSTLLQVLISIQSLILCEEPYLNEPAWANEKGTAASKAYSANVRRMVLIDAMANNLRSPPKPFENEIKTHFRLKADYIRDQITRWKEIDDGQEVRSEGYYSSVARQNGTASNSFNGAAEGVKKLLYQLSPPQKTPKGMGKAKGQGKGKGRGKAAA